MKKTSSEMREHIIEVARTLMVDKGYTAVGIAEVVAAAGVPKGSFYYYFKSKEEFGQAMLEAYFSTYLVTVDTLLAAEGRGRDRLLAYFRYWADTQGSELPDGKCLVVKLGAEVCDSSDDMRAVLASGTAGIVERLSRCIEAGQADRSITSDAPARALAEALYQMWLGASLMTKVSNTNDSFATAFDITERLLS
ncbi:MAG TPA: TetR/AcrR family transcriptional regulator [Telluria sp.]|jgi:TetR/AcrR family transcriptional repressor of nem operon